MVLPKIKPQNLQDFQRTYEDTSASYKQREILQDKPHFSNKILQMKIKDVGEDGSVESKERLKRQILNHNVRDSWDTGSNIIKKKCIYETIRNLDANWIFDDTKEFLIMFKV